MLPVRERKRGCLDVTRDLDDPGKAPEDIARRLIRWNEPRDGAAFLLMGMLSRWDPTSSMTLRHRVLNSEAAIVFIVTS